MLINKVEVDENMTKLLQVGDYHQGPHKLMKAGLRMRTDAWIVSHMGTSEKLPSPSRAQSATWAMESILAIPRRVMIRSFVATRTLRACDYSDDKRKEFNLDELEGGRLAGDVRLKDVVDDPELLAQLEDTYNEEEEEAAWMRQQATPHEPPFAAPRPDAVPQPAAADATRGGSSSTDPPPPPLHSTLYPPQQTEPRFDDAAADDSSEEEDEEEDEEEVDSSEEEEASDRPAATSKGKDKAASKGRRVIDSSDEDEPAAADAGVAVGESAAAGESAAGAVPVGTSGTKYLVEALLDMRVSAGRPAGDTHRKGTILYKVAWAGCDEVTWEPKSNISAELVDAFDEMQEQQRQVAAAAAAAETVRSASPGAEKRPRTEGTALSPSAKSPEAKR